MKEKGFDYEQNENEQIEKIQANYERDHQERQHRIEQDRSRSEIERLRQHEQAAQEDHDRVRALREEFRTLQMAESEAHNRVTDLLMSEESEAQVADQRRRHQQQAHGEMRSQSEQFADQVARLRRERDQEVARAEAAHSELSGAQREFERRGEALAESLQQERVLAQANRHTMDAEVGTSPTPSSWEELRGITAGQGVSGVRSEPSHGGAHPSSERAHGFGDRQSHGSSSAWGAGGASGWSNSSSQRQGAGIEGALLQVAEKLVGMIEGNERMTQALFDRQQNDGGQAGGVTRAKITINQDAEDRGQHRDADFASAD